MSDRICMPMELVIVLKERLYPWWELQSQKGSLPWLFLSACMNKKKNGLLQFLNKKLYFSCVCTQMTWELTRVIRHDKVWWLRVMWLENLMPVTIYLLRLFSSHAGYIRCLSSAVGYSGMVCQNQQNICLSRLRE